MVARVHIPVVLHRKRLATSLREHAECPGSAVPVAESDIEMLHKDLTDIGANPFIKYRAEKPSIVDATNRPIGHGSRIFVICQGRFRQMQLNETIDCA